MRLWETMWACDDGGTDMLLFLALAIVEEHRDVVCRFLGCFDEILKVSCGPSALASSIGC